MKRSEMVGKIKKIISICGPTQPTIDTANQIMNMLEKEGMLPPPVLRNVQTKGTLDGVKGVMYTSKTVYQWDEEEIDYGSEP